MNNLEEKDMNESVKAFPVPNHRRTNRPGNGMDLRDYFAAKIASGLAGDPNVPVDNIPELSYEIADKMMEAREK